MTEALTGPEPLAPFLETTPPRWAVRGLATILLLLFVVAVAAALLVQVPETVTAPFVLASLHGADPVRAFRSGIVGEVRIVEGEMVEQGQPIFTIASASVGDRAAEWQGLESQIESVRERFANRRDRDASQERADAEEMKGIEERIASLGRTIELKKQQLATTREIVKRQKESFESGLSSFMDLSKAQVDADGLALDVEREQADEINARRSLERLREQVVGHLAESREAERSLREELERAQIRRAVLDQDVVHQGNQLVVTAPCTGSVLKVAVRNRSAIVQEGETLAELNCGGDHLQAELTLPQEGTAKVRPGQAVKLLYTAFPYQRYGTRPATIRWISPASAPTGLRAFADIETDAVVVSGQRRSLVPGMDGTARVVVGRRTLVSYAFEPIRALRENMSAR